MRSRLIVIAMTLTTLAILVAARSAAQPTPAQPPQWEYASFVTSAEAAAWQSLDESHTALDVYGVYERLGGKLPQDKVAHTQVFNAVGRTGWELVAVTHQQGSGMSFWFRRPVR